MFAKFFGNARELPRGARAAVLSCLAVWILAEILAATGLWRVLDSALAHRLEFNVRESLHRSPQLDPRIKILTWDDRTVEFFADVGSLTVTDMPLATWARLIEVLAEAKPALIFVDRAFRFPMGRSDSADFVRRIKATGVPVHAGAFVADNAKAEMVSSPQQQDVARVAGSLWQKTWKQSPLTVGLGPFPAIEPAFATIGHIAAPKDDLMPAFLRIGQDRALTHWSIAALGIGEKDGNLTAGGLRVPTTRDGRIPVNFLAPSPLRTRAESLGWSVKAIANGKPLSNVSEGDYVVILPAYFTGNTDFKATPFGPYEGGFIQVSMLNAMLTGQTIRPLEVETLGYLAAILLAVAGVFFLEPLAFWFFYLATMLGVPVMGVTTFAFASVQVPWLSWVGVFLASGLLLLRIKHVEDARVAATFETQLQLGQAVQLTLLPGNRQGRIGPWSYAFTFEPEGPMSGDWVQIYESRNKKAALQGVVAIGDVVGKGPSAALATAVVASAWQSCVRRWNEGDTDPETLVRAIEASIFDVFQGEQNSTLSAAFLYLDRVELLTFGAPKWIHQLTDGDTQRIHQRSQNFLGQGLPLRRPMQLSFPMPHGAVLVAATDGVFGGTSSADQFIRKAKTTFIHDGKTEPLKLLNIAAEVAEAVTLKDDKTVLLLVREV